MKYYVLLLCIFSIGASCHSQEKGVFYNDGDNNRVNAIHYYKDQLFVLGQHLIREGDKHYTTSMLCTDTALNKLWNQHLGDYDEKEYLEDFCMDTKGNLYVVGGNDKKGVGVLLSFNAQGKLLFRKEYERAGKLSGIKIFNDSVLIIAGAVANEATLSDSAFVQKVDLTGNVIWKKLLYTDIGLRYLELMNDKIIFCANTTAASMALSPSPYSKMTCLSQNGNVDWEWRMDEAATGIRLGVKALKLKTDTSGIFVLCQSHNQLIPDLKLFQVSATGVQQGKYETDVRSSLTSFCKKGEGDLFLPTGLSIGGKGAGKDPQVVVKRTAGGAPFFCTEENALSIVDYVKVGSIMYTAGNVFDPKYAVHWKIEATPLPAR